MATVKQYIIHMRVRQNAIAEKMGCDVTRADKATRVLNLSTLAMLAVMMRTLTNKGVITDAELLATLDAAQADIYDKEPANPPPLPD